MKIEKLSAQQEAILPQFRSEWHRWGACTDRADRARAEAAIMKMRNRISVEEVPIFIWCASPATSILAEHFVKSGHLKPLENSLGASLENSLGASLWASLRDSLGASPRDSLRDSLENSLWASLRDSLGASLWASLRDSLGASLRDSLGASLRDSLWDSLWAILGASLENSLGDSLWASLRDSLGASPRDSLRASLWDSLGASLRDSLRNQWWGQHDSYWIAFYLFCRDVLKVQYDPQKSADLDLWRDIAQSCCWWSCYQHYVFVSDRPTAVHLDDRQVLHCENGPALTFADGWAVHSWHGVRVPATWIDSKATLTAKDALAQQNVELRRAACEILGWATVLRDLKAKTIDHDADPQIGDLLEVSLPDAGRERFLKVHCGTGREFAIPVPPTMRTALEANAWTYDIPQDLLKLKENRT